MAHHELILFFLQLSIMLACALIFGQLMHRLRQPVVLGELIGGLLLGPTIFGLLAPGWYAWLFPPSETLALARDSVIKLGMLFFMFVAGLEVNLNHLQARAWSTTLTSILGIAAPFGAGFGAVLLWPNLWGLQAVEQPVLFGLFIGAALSISALPVIARTLSDLGLLKQELGLIIIAAATLNDLIGWSLFAVILSNLSPDQPATAGLWLTLALVTIFLAVILIIGRWFGRRGLIWIQSHLTWPNGFIAIVAIFVLIAAAIAEAIGIHAFFGAFLVGVGMQQHVAQPHQVYKAIEQIAFGFLAPIYFVSIGLGADFAANFDITLILVVIIVATVGKVVGASGGAWLSGMSPKESLAVGFGLNARGAMEIILASVALEYGLIDQRLFVALVIMALVTSMLSGPMIRILLKKHPVYSS